MLKIAILQDSEFVTFAIVISSSNVGSTIIVVNDGVSIPFLLQQVVGFKLIVVIVIVKLIIVVITAKLTIIPFVNEPKHEHSFKTFF